MRGMPGKPDIVLQKIKLLYLLMDAFGIIIIAINLDVQSAIGDVGGKKLSEILNEILMIKNT